MVKDSSRRCMKKASSSNDAQKGPQAGGLCEPKEAKKWFFPHSLPRESAFSIP